MANVLPPPQQPTPNIPQEITTSNNYNEIKSVLSAKLPENQKLRDESNWSTWNSSIGLLFQLLNLHSNFTENNYNHLNHLQKTAALIFIRQNLIERPLNLIFNEPDA